MNRSGLILMMIFTGSVSAAGAIEYRAGLHESAWHFTGSKRVCELRHSVPNYGVARFSLPAGELLRFQVDAFRPAPAKGTATLREVSPSWVHREAESSQYTVPISAGIQPLAIQGDAARWLLNTLARGRMGSFDFREGEQDWSRVRFSVSPVNFQKSYADFRQCTRALDKPNTALSGVEDIHFPTDVHVLDGQARMELERIATQVADDPTVREIVVKGYTDSVGRRPYNNKLSARRAKSVFGYLKKQGVKNKITRLAFGENQPKADNRSQTGRAVNRRVEIELVRDTPKQLLSTDR